MKKILIVEDDRFLANAYRVKLTKEKFEVEMAKDGIEGLEKAESFKPDLIILDLMMPRMDGFGFLKEIKSKDTIKDIPVMIASNLGQQEDIDKGLSMGAVDYFIKSDVAMQDIVTKINAHLEK